MIRANEQSGPDEFGDGSAFDPPDGARLIVELDGYDGPLDLLLDLARRDKVDLAALSILWLADQYIAYIRAAQHLRLELAGDYLVMAAWLTYLKSRLLLPRDPEDEAPPAEDLAQDLAERLRRLDLYRRAGARLGALLEEGRAALPRGAAEAVIVERRAAWHLDLATLVSAYIERRQARERVQYRVALRRTLSIPDARRILERLIGRRADWCPLHVLVAAVERPQADRRGAQASSFAAALELAREGRVDLKQDGLFADLYVRRARRDAAPVDA